MNPTQKLSQAEIIQRHADNVAATFPSHDLKSLAADLETDVDAYEEGREKTLAIAAELRLRAAAGVRKGPGPKRW